MLRDNNKSGVLASYLPLTFGAVVTVLVIYFLYLQTQSILKERLQQRIESMVSIAALQLSPKDVEDVIKNESILSDLTLKVTSGSTERFDIAEIQRRIQLYPELRSSPILKLTNQMKAIRDAAPNIRYIYIWKQTNNPTKLTFVTDSDTVYPVDWDNNGKIDELEIPPLPGEEYDVSDVPELQNEAFKHAVVLNDFIVDKWGIFLSGFAPIRDSNGNTIADLGMDVEVGDFYRVVSATLIPFTLLGATLLLLLSLQTVALIRIWKSRLEFFKELDRQKDELLGLVSHQLATPVSSIKWYTEMLLDGDMGALTKDQQENISAMAGIGANMSDLVGMILDVSRIQLGRMKIEKQELDLKEFFHEITSTIEPKAEEKKVKFEMDMPESFPKAMLDKRYTNMTIENLLTNAVKYTPAGGSVKLTVKIANNRMKVTVKDTGMGIPKADQDKIFGKMFRATNVRNAVEGNGFGLFVAKGAVEAQGGKIWFESTEGKGTTFYVDLPLVG